MATEDEPHSELAAQDTGKLTAQDTGKLTAQETGEPTAEDTEKPTTQGSENAVSDKPTNERPKKPPPKKPANCELCNVILVSQSIVDAHMASKRHAKKVQAAESMKAIIAQRKVAAGNSSQYRCDICNITLNSQQQKDLHLSGQKHKYKVQKSGEANEMCSESDTTFAANSGVAGAQVTKQPAGGITTETDSSIAVQATDLKCTVCNITVNSVQQLTQHLSSKKHQLRESGVKRPPPFNRFRRGGMGRGGIGRGGPGSFEMPRAPGAFGARGRGRGRGQNPARGLGPARGHGPTRGQGPARGWCRGGGVNSLNSSFQSAGFALNFQGLGGQQSLKRERSDSTFGNGNNDDVSNNSYYQGKKIPRGAQSAAFNSMDSMDSNTLRSGSNASGGGNNSFGGGDNSFGAGNASFGSGTKPFGRGSKSPRGGNKPFGRGNKSFGVGNNAFGGGSNSFGGESNSFGGGSSSFGGGSTFASGISSFASGNTSFAGGNSSFGGGKASYGRGEGSFGAGNTFGDYNNSLRSGSGRGNTRGGFEIGRGFGQRGGFGNTAQDGGY